MEYSLALGVLVLGAILWSVQKFTTWLRDLEARSRVERQFSLFNPQTSESCAAPTIWDRASKQLSIVVPCYNEDQRMRQTLDETLAYLQQRRDRAGPAFTYEIIIVDDGSKDNTVLVGYEYGKKHGFDTVRVLKLGENCGKGTAVREGLSVARGAICLMMDADGATRISDVEQLEKALASVAVSRPGSQQGEGDSRVSGSMGDMWGMAVGSRAHLEKAAVAKRAWYRNLLMHGFHLLVMLVAGNDVKDTQCGFKLFTRPAARVLHHNQRLRRYCFDVELVYLCHRLGIPIKEVHVHWTEMPGSKVKVTSMVHMALEICALKAAYALFGLWSIRTKGLAEAASAS